MAMMTIRRADGLRSILAFFVLGLVNAILPFIIFKAAYLIIPFPRPIVLTIQALPAIAAKLVLPHTLYLKLPFPFWTRPFALALGWTLAASVAYVTPPNVPSPIRIFTVILASLLSAGGDVFWLSQLRFYGKPGLQGWGVGTGVGLALGAVLPYWVTVVMGAFFRDTIPYLSLLVCLMIATHFIVLPRAPNLPTRAGAGSLPKSGGTYQDEEEEDLNMTHFLIENSPPISSMTNDQRFKSNMRLFVTLAYPLILPLLLCSAGYAITYTGFSRALAATPSFDRYTSYIAAYGLAFQLGNLTGRSSYLFSRISLPGNETLITAMTIGAAAVLLNAIFIVVSSSVIVFLLVFTVGVSVGMVYINTLAATLERTTLSVQETEFSLGAVGVGEPTGLLLGGLVGHLLEKTICGLDTGSGQRWCDTTR